MRQQGTSVTTSYLNGTTINMDACATLMFLRNLATTTIVQIREIEFIERYGWTELSLKLPHYNDLIEEYCPGVPSAVIQSMIDQNIEILYQFVRDCVENDNKRGLYLMVEKSRQDKPFWRCILQALTEYTQYIEKLCEIRNSKCITRYDDYNQRFEDLMTR